MKRLVQWLALVPISLAFHAPPALGAVDIFLKIDGIPGESQAKGYEKWIEIDSFSWGLSNAGSASGGTGAGSGKVQFQDFHFTKKVDASSPLLFLETARGTHFSEAILDVVRAGSQQPQAYLKYTLTDVQVTSYQVSGASGSVPTDSFSLNFEKIKYDYFPQKPDGSLGAPISATWDLTQTAPVPEPSTWAMLIAGLAFVAFRGRRSLQARAA